MHSDARGEQDVARRSKCRERLKQFALLGERDAGLASVAVPPPRVTILTEQRWHECDLVQEMHGSSWRSTAVLRRLDSAQAPPQPSSRSQTAAMRRALYARCVIRYFACPSKADQRQQW